MDFKLNKYANSSSDQKGTPWLCNCIEILSRFKVPPSASIVIASVFSRARIEACYYFDCRTLASASMDSSVRVTIIKEVKNDSKYIPYLFDYVSWYILVCLATDELAWHSNLLFVCLLVFLFYFILFLAFDLYFLVIPMGMKSHFPLAPKLNWYSNLSDQVAPWTSFEFCLESVPSIY